jgi:hypothetical protein
MNHYPLHWYQAFSELVEAVRLIEVKDRRDKEETLLPKATLKRCHEKFSPLIDS